MYEALIKALVESGKTEAEAKQIADRAQTINDRRVPLEDLSKALDDIRDLKTGEGAEALRKALEAAESAETQNAILAEHSDKIHAQQEMANEAFAKGLLYVGSVLTAQSKALEELTAELRQFRAGAKDRLDKSLDAPLSPRAIRTTMDQVDLHPGELADPNADNTQRDALSKAQALSNGINDEMRKSDVSIQRRRELATAASQLESGVPAEVIAKAFNLPLRAAN